MTALFALILAARLDGDRIADWLVDHGVRIAVILAVVAIILLILRHAVPRAVDAMVRRRALGRSPDETAKRVKTLTTVFVWTVEVVLLFVALFMVLPELGVNVAPIIAGVGVVGIAIGLGAQTLVRDTINGLFILIENQYGIGDVITVAGISGRVEEVNLRRTVLRDLDGTVHSVPNSEIRVASNHTREWSGVNMDVTVAYGADLDKATAVIDRVGKELAADPQYADLITQPPHVVRVDAFKDSGVSLKVLGVTRPIRQWEVMGELRKRLKKAFEEESIELRW